MTRPTPEQINEARSELEGYTRAEWVELCGEAMGNAVCDLIAATEPPTDEELYALAKQQWAEDAAADDELDYTEGFHHGARHFLGTPEGK